LTWKAGEKITDDTVVTSGCTQKIKENLQAWNQTGVCFAHNEASKQESKEFW